MFSMTDDSVIDEQIEYYRARASEYDDSYARRGRHDRGLEANAAWWDELHLLEEALAAVALGFDVLELAAGTGYWTERLVDRGLRVTAVDAAPEALDINRQRLGGRAVDVDYVVDDVFAWTPARTWDACVMCFFLCHVPDDLLLAFLGAVARAVTPGGAVFVGDKALHAHAGPTERRTLDDGRTFTIVERVRTQGELSQAFDIAGFDVDVKILGPRFSAVSGRRRVR